MTKEDVLSTYRSEITDEAAKKIDDMVTGVTESGSTYYVRYGGGKDGEERPASRTGILAGLEAHPGLPHDESLSPHHHNLIEVFEVEWIEVDRKDGKQTRHEGVQIGNEVYITRGESEYIVRSADCPNRCRLSVNGIFFLDKNGDPYSLMVNTMDLQDKYDLLIYCRDNLIASSGTVGDWVDVAFLPTFLGATMPERIQRWKGHKKDGVALFNSQMEGGERMTNTTFNGFDDTVKAQSIQAIQIAIQSVEQQASSITGVLPERLAQYEQRDAVSNVQLGVKMSGLLTKQYFEIMDTMYKEVNYDLLNLAKLVYKKGITGTLILGDKFSKIFTAMPEHYTITDFDIHIEDSSKSFQEMENVKILNTELIKAGMSNPELAIEIATSKSMTHLKTTVAKAMAQQQEKNDQTQQLQEQIKQMDQQAKEMQKQNSDLQKQIKQLQSKISENEDLKMQLEQERVAIEREKMKIQRDYNDKMIDIKDKQLQVQREELNDDSPYNDKVKGAI
jgi:hypothetical protein